MIWLAKKRVSVAITLILIIAAAIVVLCSYLDKTVHLPGDGRGLANHYGIWAIFVTSPLLVLLAHATQQRFVFTIRTINRYTVNADVPQVLREMVDKHINSLHMNARSRYVFWLLVVVGWYWWLVNVKQTIYPFDSYQNDVFDAYPHTLGFISFKLYLGFVWVVVYPVISYSAGHIFVSMVAVLKHMRDRALFRLDYFHQDDCGGVSVFGAINLRLLAMSSLVLLTALAILLTHRGNYVSIWSSIVTCILLMIAQSVVGVYYIHVFVRQKKIELLAQINKRLNRSLISLGRQDSFPDDLLAVRNHIARLRTVPYTRAGRIMINLLRLSPAAAGMMNLFWRL